jgi:MFS family permease
VLAYLLVSQAAVQVAAPYITPYLLDHLQFPYWRYAVLICAMSLAKILFLPALGRLMDRWGAGAVLWVAALAVAPLPALWLVCHWFPFLVGVQILSGIAWGGSDLATLLLFFATIPRAKRVGVLTVFNLLNAAAMVAGSALGGLLLWLWGADHGAYGVVFVVSSLARAASATLLLRMPASVPRRQIVIARIDGPQPLRPRPAALPVHGELGPPRAHEVPLSLRNRAR